MIAPDITRYTNRGKTPITFTTSIIVASTQNNHYFPSNQKSLFLFVNKTKANYTKETDKQSTMVMGSSLSRSDRPIDSEWAEQLLGLCLKVPSHWWQGHSGSDVHDGKLTSFDESVGKWVLSLDDIDNDEPYLMRYDAVVKYCDTEASTFANYTLPVDLLSSLN